MQTNEHKLLHGPYCPRAGAGPPRPATRPQARSQCRDPSWGTVRPAPAQLALLRKTVERLGAPWASDHLTFNATPEFSTGFFLPPRQTPEGVETVARAIRDLQEGLPVPIAVETGVNYLRPRPDEMPDGAFV